MLPVPQSTSLVVVFKAYLSSDHVSEATGKTIAITISKNGGAFGNPNAGATNATEISSGWYKVTLDTTDTNTVGPLAVRGAVATVDDVGVLYHVVKATNGGWTALPDTAVTTNASLLTSGTGTAQLSVSSGAVTVGTNNDKTGYTASTVSDKTGYSLSQTFPSNFSSLAVTAAGKVTVGTNDDKTGYTVSTVSDKTGYSLASSGLSAVTSWSVAITGNITGNLSGSVGSVTGLTASNLDVAVSTRLASGSYTAPLDAAGTRSAVGLSSANLDTQLAAIAGYIDTEVGAIYSRIGAPAGASIAADIAALPTTTTVDAIKVVTDALPTFVHTGGKLWVLNEDGNSIAGDVWNSNRDAYLKSLTINNTSGVGLNIQSQTDHPILIESQGTSNHDAIKATAQGAGHGVYLVGGADGAGMKLQKGASGASDLIADNLANIPADPASDTIVTGQADLLLGEIQALPQMDTVMSADIKKVNGVVITGGGVEDADEWRPA